MSPSAIAPLRAADIAAEYVPRAVVLLEIEEAGVLVVDGGHGCVYRCHWLETCGSARVTLAKGDLLAITKISGAGWVALGRIGPYVPPSDDGHLVLTAKESLSLQCGDSSLTLRADGKVMIKGEDVLLRAKGTQRIRAGNVAIN